MIVCIFSGGRLKFKKGRSINIIIIIFGVVWFILRCRSDEECNWLVFPSFLPPSLHPFIRKCPLSSCTAGLTVAADESHSHC